MAHTSKRIVIVGSLCAAGLFAAWLGLRSTVVHAGRFTDGEALYDAVRFAAWETPRPVPAPVSSPAAETHPALARDGRSIVFAVGERGLNMDLYMAELDGDAALDPRPIEVLNTGADECTPTFHGQDLYFASDRAGGEGGLDLYRARWTGAAFSVPERLAGPINSPADDCDPAPRPGVDEIVFASNRGSAGFDLYVASPSDAAVHTLAALDTAGDEREPAFSPDGRALFFASDREHAGSFDLWHSFVGADGWLEPTPLDSLNSAGSERGPCPTADGFTLYFTREVAGDAADVLRARTLELYRLPARPVSWSELSVVAALLALALMAFLAGRWPALETIYKCFLVSVLLHLALLWWFRGVIMESGGHSPEDRPHRYPVRLISPTDQRLTEHGGRLRTERTTTEGTEPALARPNIMQPSSAPPAPPGDAIVEAVVPPAEQVASAHARAPSEFASDVHTARSPVELQDDESAPARRAGGARELALAPSPTGSGTGPRRADGEPARAQIAPRGTSDESAPTSRLELAVGRGPTASAPARAAVAAAESLRARSDNTAVALAMPIDGGDGGDGSDGGGAGGAGGTNNLRSSAAPGLALDALAAGAGRASSEGASAGSDARGRADAPDRYDAQGGGAGGDGAATSPPALSSLSSGVTPPTSTSGPRERAAASFEPLGSGHNPLVLQDGEAPVTRIGGQREADGTHVDGDILATLVPSAAARSGAAESSTGPSMQQGPQKLAQGFAGDGARADTAPAFELPIAPPTSDREPPAVPRTSWDHTPYQNRAGEEKARAIELHGGSAETEQAVERGLAYLAKIQRPGGEWGDLDALDDKYGQVAVGKTGLALLAFLGAGHTHVSGTRHSPTVQHAIEALLALQDEASGHFGDTSAYSHGIATFALAECLALSGDERLRAPLQAAVAHILAHQSQKRDPRFFGGWGYFYPDERTFDRWPRTSITVWQVMALESARLSGVDVPDAAFDGAREFLENARDEDGEYYRYNHDPERLGSGYPTLPASTPAALFALSLLGEDLQSAAHAPERAFVLNRAPKGYRYTSDDAFVHRAQGNLYFWYYGTLAMFRVGGGAWATWNEAMKKTLLPAQEADGSWRPIDIYARYARDNDADRSYTTTMCVLSLEIYYRYFLPLLKVR